MIGKICKYIIISVLILLFVLTLLLTINSSFRRTIFTNSFAAINLYYIVSIQTHLKNRYDVEGASNKLLNYIEFSKKIANGKSRLLLGINDATKLVESKASTKEDYLILEKVFKALVDMDVLGDPMPGINNESGYNTSGPLAPLNKVSGIPMLIKS